jgi:hypothetical protein
VAAAETLGFESYAPPYLSPQASGKNLLIGANFASAASSYDDDTAAMYVSTIIRSSRTICQHVATYIVCRAKKGLGSVQPFLAVLHDETM